MLGVWGSFLHFGSGALAHTAQKAAIKHHTEVLWSVILENYGIRDYAECLNETA